MADNCPKCDYEINTDRNYECPVCKEKFWQSQENFKKHLESLDPLVINDKTSIRPKIKWWEYINFAVMFFLDRFFGLGVTMLSLALSVAVGDYLASLYSKKIKKENSLTKVIPWLNMIAWLLPIIGVMISVASIRLSSNFGRKDNKYIVLGIIGLTLSLINVVINIWLRLK